MEKKSYARESANKNLFRAATLLLVLFLFAVFIGLYIQWMFSFRDCILLLSGIVIGVCFYYMMEKVLLKQFLPRWGTYKGFKQGAAGEREVNNSLNQNLSEGNLILSDVKLGKNKGNIDHIVIGKYGVYVIETKTHRGRIICDGDIWFQEKKRGEKTEQIKLKYSPSKQAKSNAVLLKSFLMQYYPKISELWVYAIVVFPHKQDEIEIKNTPKECEIFGSIDKMIERIKKGKTFEITSDDLSQLKTIFMEREQQIYY
jgi:hypothetical protein